MNFGFSRFQVTNFHLRKRTMKTSRTRATRSPQPIEVLEDRRLMASDLSISFEELPAEVLATSELSFVVKVRNEGPDDAVDALVDIPGGELKRLTWTRTGPYAFPREVDVEQLAGTNGFAIAQNSTGFAIGDVNADGSDDLLLTDDDFSYVVFGAADMGGDGLVSIETLDPSRGFELVDFGERLSAHAAGDVNGDGVDDFLVGTQLVFGSENIGSAGFVSWGDSSQAILVASQSFCEHCRQHLQVVPVGDINGDGFDDLVFVDSEAPRTVVEVSGSRTRLEAGPGMAWVIFGRADLGQTNLDRLDGTTGFQIRVDTQQQIHFGSSANSVGDVNADGFADLFFSAFEKSGDTGYLILGSEEIGETGELLISDDGQDQVLKFHDTDRFFNDIYPQEVSDINGDGVDDIVLRWKVIFGGDLSFQQFRDDEGLIDVSNVVVDESRGLTWPDRPPSNFGDFDDDGELDAVYTLFKNGVFTGGISRDYGAIFVDLGLDSADSKIEGTSPDDGKGFVLHEPNEFGLMRSEATGDFNGDGIDDLLFRRDQRVHVLLGSRRFHSFRTGPVRDRIDIPRGGEVTYTLHGVVPGEASEAISFSGAVSSNDDRNPENNEAISSRIVVRPTETSPEVDLGVTLEDGKEFLFPGDRVTYVATISNLSDAYAESAAFSVSLDENLTNPRWKLMDGSPDGNAEIEGPLVTLVSLAPQESLTYEVSASATSFIGALTTTAQIVASAKQTDTEPSNNRAVDVNSAPRRFQVPTRIANIKPCFDDTATVDGRLIFAGVDFYDHCYAERTQGENGFFGGSLFRTDGTREGTTLLMQSRPVSEEIRWDQPLPADTILKPNFTEFNGAVYFAAADPAHEEELWVTDGTPDGTHIVLDINQVPVSRNVYLDPNDPRVATLSAGLESLLALDEWMLFAADDGVHGRELWRSDGTAEGTSLLKDIHPGPQSGMHRESYTWEILRGDHTKRAIVYNNVYYFVADDGKLGVELWRSDGTGQGTFMLKDLRPGDDDAFLKEKSTPDFRIHQGLLYFTVNGSETWRTDGTVKGTTRSSPVGSPADQLVVQLENATVWYEDGFFYRTENGRDEIIANWTTLPVLQPTWMKAIGDKIVFNPSSDPSYDRDARLYSFDISETQIDAGGTYELILDDLSESSVRQTFASEVLAIDDIQSAEELLFLEFVAPGYLDDFDIDLIPYADLPASHFNVLGNNERSAGIGPTRDQSFTVGFPAPLVDVEGHDLFVEVDAAFDLFAITQSGAEIPMGQVSWRDNKTAELPPADEPIVAVKFQYARDSMSQDEYGNVTWVEGKIDAAIVLTASGDRTPDAEFSWDINNDGIFDRFGRSVGLNNEDLAEFGLDRPGEYTVGVRMNDRVRDYFDTAIIRVLEGEPTELSADINLDGKVAFDDFLILAENFAKQNATRDEGDLNGDQTVDFLDFLVLANDFGKTV